MTRPTVRPYNDRKRRLIAAYLRALADELEAGHAQTVQRLLGETIGAHGYPNRSSGADGAGPGHQTDEHGQPVQPDTPTERAALNHDPTHDAALRTLDQLTILTRTVRELLPSLRSWNPARPVETCPICGYPKQRGVGRCTNIIDGQQCAARKQTRQCVNCEKIMEPGEHLRAGRCDPCRKQFARTGRERVAKDMLDLGPGIIIVDTVAHTEDLETA